MGSSAGVNLSTGSNNIDIGNLGAAGESDTIRIGSTQTRTFYQGNSWHSGYGNSGRCQSGGQLGVAASSARFKDDIKPMNTVSEAILALRPVTFCYKQEIDPERTSQFGLVAEEVEKVSADLVVRDKEGKINTVRYEAVNAMLLNEFKEHRKVQELEAAVAEQRKGMAVVTAQLKEQAAQIQKVSAQAEMSKFATGRIRRGGPAPRMVLNP